ncbi:MAG: cell division protein FtsL [Chromatiales bacterium]|nr:cell division protein FtsL [Chromatiales bacterium]
MSAADAFARRLPAVVAVLAAVVLTSGLAAVYARHQSRKLFIELQALTAERDRLEMDWGRLQIEQSTQASHARVEQLARDQLQMRLPDPREIRVVGP